MSIKRYVASEDSTITNAFKPDSLIRATGSNMGSSDILEVFSIYGLVNVTSSEASRVIMKFPIDDIKKDRNAGLIPNSGSANFFLKIYNAEHPFSLPKEFFLSAHPVSQSWEEGYGLDMETYRDPGANNNINGYGVNWIYAGSGSIWTTQGGTYLTSGYDDKQFFSSGYEDLDLNITKIVEDWIAGTLPNYGLILKLSGAYEDTSLKRSFYTKRFFGRGTNLFYKKPIIECAWEDYIKDDRAEFYSVSNLLSDNDNTYNLFFYNRYNGKLKNIVSNPNLLIKLYSDTNYTNEVNVISSSVTNPSIGVYRASIRVNSTASALYDKWYLSGSENTVYFRSSFDLYQYEPQESYSEEENIYTLTNLKSKYRSSDNAIIRIFSREKNWNPNVYSVSSNNIENSPIKNLFYRIFRIDDGLEIIPYSTGSLEYSKTSYDTNGNYFSLDMSIFEPDYSYGINLARWDGSTLQEFNKTYKFRVE